MGPKNTPFTRINNMIESKLYSLNQDNQIIMFNAVQLLFRKIDEKVLKTMKFVLASDYKDAIKDHYAKIEQLKHDLFGNVFLTTFKNNIIVIGHDNKLLFTNITNGKQKILDLSTKMKNLEIIYDFGILKNNIIYIFGQGPCEADIKIDKMYLWKLSEKLDAQFIGECGINSNFKSIRYKFRTSSVGNENQVICWLTGSRYIKIEISSIIDKMCIKSFNLNISRSNLNNINQQIVEATNLDDENVMLHYSKGSMVKFNHKINKIISITNPVHNQWINRMKNQDWRMIRGLILPKQSQYGLLSQKLIHCYVRENYSEESKIYVPIALKQMIQRYHDEYRKQEVITFIGAMCWSKEIGRGNKLQNMRMITAGIYAINGKYDEIQGSEMHYEEPEKL